MNTDRRLSPFVLFWLLVLTFSASFVAYTLSTSSPFYSNIMELLPEDERNPALNSLTQEIAGGFENRLLILLRAQTDQQSLQQARQLQSGLLVLPGVAAGEAEGQWLTVFKAMYQPYLSQLLTDEARQRLSDMSAEQIAQQQLQQLMSPIATPRLYTFAEDPFGLGSDWLNQVMGAVKLSLFEGFPAVVGKGGERWLVVTAELVLSPFDVAVQQRITALVNQQRYDYPETQVLTSGLVFHAAAGTAQAKQEISSVGLGSLLGIIVLVLLVFRSVVPLALVLVVLSGGCLLALTVSLLVFDRIHLITLVFGSTLLGVSVDYAFHFLVKAHRYNSGIKAIAAVRLALAVGALTSISAYLLQWLAPFPGLQQMAIFSASGLLGAWLTLLCCGHWYSPRVKAGAVHGGEEEGWSTAWVANCLSRVCRVFSIRRYAVFALLVILTAGAVAVIVTKGSNDSVASLNTSGKALLQSEGRVQLLLQYPSSQQFFMVTTATEQQLLQELEQLEQSLRRELPDVITHSVINYVPSQQKQLENAALIREKLYAEDGALIQLCALLAMDCDTQRQALNKPVSMLQRETLSASPLAALMPLVMYQDGEWHSLLGLAVNEGDKDILSRVATEHESVVFVDQSANLTSLLSHYRKNVSVILAGTLFILALVMLLRYGRRAWRMLVPLYISLLVAMACAALGGGLTLFHMAALLLVLGIGVDTGVFYLEVGLQPDSWLAATLASLTSVLAFGLLSLSAVPVLQQFGVVVLSGILCCWLVTPMFFTPQYSRNAKAKDSL